MSWVSPIKDKETLQRIREWPEEPPVKGTLAFCLRSVLAPG